MQQAFHIDRLQAELANANPIAAETGVRNEPEVTRPIDRVEKAPPLHQESAAKSDAFGAANSALTRSEVSSSNSTSETIGLPREAKVAAGRTELRGSLNGQAAAPSAENGFRAAITSLMNVQSEDGIVQGIHSVTSTVQAGSFEDDLPIALDADAAERETIGSIEAVLSTVVWRALRTTAAEASPISSVPVSAAVIACPDQHSEEAASSNRSQHDRSDHEKAQTHLETDRPELLDLSRPGRGRVFLIGSLFGLIVSLLAAAAVAAFWIWNRQ